MRESLGTVRVHLWTCDVDGVTVEHRSKASGVIPLPTGWMRVAMDVVTDDGKMRRREAEVCSTTCATKFSADVLDEQKNEKKQAAAE